MLKNKEFHTNGGRNYCSFQVDFSLLDGLKEKEKKKVGYIVKINIPIRFGHCFGQTVKYIPLIIIHFI